MRTLTLAPLIILALLLGGCSIEQARSMAAKADGLVAQTDARVAQLADLAAGLPEGTPYREQVEAALGLAKDASATARQSAAAAHQALAAAEAAQAAGGGVLEIALAALAAFIPGAGAAVVAFGRARKSYDAMRQTFRAVEDAKPQIDAAPRATLLAALSARQDDATKRLIDELQGKL